jgi:hypothetical protein
VCQLEFGEVYVQALVNVGGNRRLDSISPVRQFSEYTREPNLCFAAAFSPLRPGRRQPGRRPSVTAAEVRRLAHQFTIRTPSVDPQPPTPGLRQGWLGDDMESRPTSPEGTGPSVAGA